MFLVSGRARRCLAVGLGFCLALPFIGSGVAFACEGGGEENPSKVLTVERAGGPEAVVDDAVKVSLLTGTRSHFITKEGEIGCSRSEIEGRIKSNPVSGHGEGEIKIENFSFGECTTNIPEYTTRGVVVEGLSLIATTVGTTGFKIKEEGGSDMWLRFTGESGGLERICVYAENVKPTYRNNNESELEFDQEGFGVFVNRMNCGGAQFPLNPTWKASYRPLQDETGGRAGKRIFIN